MEFSKYVKELKRITMQDVIDTIKSTKNVYGFRNQKGIILFGELQYSWVVNPSIVICENEDNLCQELYDMIETQLQNDYRCDYEHSFSGDNDYYCDIQSSGSTIYFPNYKQSHQDWINERVAIKRQLTNK